MVENTIFLPQRRFEQGDQRDIVSFHARFTDLARLIGESPDTALYGSRQWEIYILCTKRCLPRSSTLLARSSIWRDKKAMPPRRYAVLDADNLKHNGAQTS